MSFKEVQHTVTRRIRICDFCDKEIDSTEVQHTIFFVERQFHLHEACMQKLVTDYFTNREEEGEA